jgi:hypothetical protein
MITGARVAKPGQRRQVQGLISQEFEGSNPFPRILILGYSYLSFWNSFHKIAGAGFEIFYHLIWITTVE